MRPKGDKLSPTLRQASHEVVAATPPPGDVAVTQTTIDPLINQKLPLPTGSGSTDYIFPRQLSPKERALAKPQLDTIDASLAQAVLDELSARLNANKVTGAPLSYLRSLISRAKAGLFTPEAGIRIAAAREQATLEKIKKSAEVIKPSNPSDIPKYLDAMHQAIGRKSQSVEQEKS
ncbi:hypothetical protein [Methylobacillus rhizosphaerae]|nr:hypothetical protein [Methylobacillus rhizosphaerae]